MTKLFPAVAYKEQIESYSDRLRYSEQMMFYNGCLETGRMQIQVEPTEGRYQWAIVNSDNQLVGYIAYMVDFYSSNAYGFGLITFIDDKKAMTSGIRQAIRHLTQLNLHRIEFRCIGDNPALQGYDAICKRIKGYYFHRVRLHDIFKDSHGNYHDCWIFEGIKVQDTKS